MRRGTIVLTQRDVVRVIDMRTAIRVVRQAFGAMARGQTTMPSKIYLPLSGNSDFRAMPARLRHPAACGVKWVNVHPANRRRGLPTVMAIIVLNDPATGFPLAVMDGVLITKLRTAAAGAVAAQALARRSSRIIGLIGCGAQAAAQLLALAECFTLERVKVWGDRPQEAARFCQQARKQLAGTVLEPCAELADCTRGVDILVTVTPSRRPLIRRAWLAPGTHVNAIGADAPGKQELDPRILRDATVVVDEREQAIHGGELNVPIRREQFRPRQIHATLGQVLIGERRGRGSSEELTVFDSTGLAVHDVALAFEVFQRARHRRLGHRVRFFGV